MPLAAITGAQVLRLAAGDVKTWNETAKAVQAAGYDEEMAYTLGLWGVHLGLFVILNLTYAALHLIPYFDRWRLPRKPAQEPSRRLLLWALTYVGFGQIVLQPLITYGLYHLTVWVSGNAPVFSSPPSWATVAWQVVACLLISDFTFYWAHRSLHESKLLYKYVHKQHHEFKGTVGIASEYAHPVELIYANIGTVMAGPVLLGLHFYPLCVYLFFRVWETIESHSGYDLPWSPWHQFSWQGGAAFHDFHHTENRGNYGGALTSLWDKAFGTDAPYQKHLLRLAKKRR